MRHCEYRPSSSDPHVVVEVGLVVGVMRHDLLLVNKGVPIHMLVSDEFATENRWICYHLMRRGRIHEERVLFVLSFWSYAWVIRMAYGLEMIISNPSALIISNEYLIVISIMKLSKKL